MLWVVKSEAFPFGVSPVKPWIFLSGELWEISFTDLGLWCYNALPGNY